MLSHPCSVVPEVQAKFLKLTIVKREKTGKKGEVYPVYLLVPKF